jgi:hypothetical protein
VLEHLLAPCSSFLHVRDVMGAARMCLSAQIGLLPSMGACTLLFVCLSVCVLVKRMGIGRMCLSISAWWF